MKATDTPDDQTTESPRASVPFRVTSESAINDAVDPYFLGLSAQEGLNSREMFTWGVEEGSLDLARLATYLGGVAEEVLSTAHYRRFGKAEVLVRLDGALVNVQFTPANRLWVGVAAATHEKASAAMDRVVGMFPEKRERPGEPTVAVSVWSADASDPLRRMCEVEPWENLEANYAPETRSDLAALLHPDFQPGKGGRLILLHGAPGTGKSTALATLAWEWRTWAELHYIADPAAFLSDPTYLFNVTLGRRPEDKWRVVLIEDVGGLFGPDAKQHAGEDRLGRLLNSTDGMLGHASKALYILTSNEPLSSFHAAVSRPGRCAAAVEFLPFDETAAKAWLTGHARADLAAEVQGARTLAELYAMLHGTQVEVRPKQRVGFLAGAA